MDLRGGHQGGSYAKTKRAKSAQENTEEFKMTLK